MKRRKFLQSSFLASVSLLLSRSGFGQRMADSVVPVDLAIDTSVAGHAILPSYMGLSYEQAQLGNPSFFAGTNTQLVGMVQTLGRHGVLRIDGNTSDRNTFWSRSAKPSEKKL